jgi:branched-subunit amino acid aminotransferase/4-amino-4-deoxychorismate lyase
VPEWIEVDGRPFGTEHSWLLRAMTYGHFSSMQVRAGRVRGLGLHLSRLDRASVELFGTGLEPVRVRAYLAGALGRATAATGTTDFSARVSVHRRADDADLAVLVVLGPGVDASDRPVALHAVTYQRELPHLKHTNTLGLIHQRRVAERAGADDALFAGTDGLVSEAGVWNLWFYDGAGFVRPRAPALDGITQQLVLAGLRRHGVRVEDRPVPLAEVGSFRAAYLTNSADPARPVGSIGGVRYDEHPEAAALLIAAYESSPWDPAGPDGPYRRTP